MTKATLKAIALAALAVPALTGCGRMIVVGEEQIPGLSPAAAAAVEKRYSGMLWTKTERERARGMVIHEVELRHGGKEVEVEVAPDGTIMEIETKVSLADVPEAAAEVVREFARFAIMLKLEKKEVFARTAPVRLPKPGIVFEAEIRKSFWRKREIEVAPDGKVVKDTDG